MIIEKPKKEEYGSFYQGYIDRVPSSIDAHDFLDEQNVAFVHFIGDIPKEKIDFVYQPEKWTVGQVLGHIVDTERILSTRLLWFVRNDQTPLPGFEEKEYVKNGVFEGRSVDSLIREFHALRMSNMELIGSFSTDQMTRSGAAM